MHDLWFMVRLQLEYCKMLELISECRHVSYLGLAR